MQVRRVVTGQDAAGRSIFVSDERIDPITVSLMPGAAFHGIWGSDATVQLPTDGSPPPFCGNFPPVGGFRFGFFTLGPDTITLPSDLDLTVALAELNAKLPGMAEVMEPDHPGMHTTETIDINLVISGEIWLELDDGAEVQLKAGDCVVQNGTRHAWHNTSDAACTMAVAIVGAQRRR